MGLDRAPLLADTRTVGAAWCHAHAALVDEWLRSLFHAAADGRTDGVALVAIGGYGRGELAPGSDIDVMLVRTRQRDVAELADRIWYPVWDEGLHLGHSVSTVPEALDLAGDDLVPATALLSARYLAGDRDLAASLADGALLQWRRRAKRWLPELGAGVALRHERAGEVAFMLEPDLKEGRGGLRDAHALWWAAVAARGSVVHDDAALQAAYEVLLGARVELQRHTGRTSNDLVLEDQDAVATALGDRDADALMARVAEAARAISWISDDGWRRIRSSLRGPLGRLGRRSRAIGPNLALADGEVTLSEDADPADPVLVLRAAAAAATHGTDIDRRSVERLAATAPPLPDPWTDEQRRAFVDLLLAGPPAIRVIETLDQRDLWRRVLPEWTAVRARPQRNAYHRFTVDRHLLETAANAARLADRVDRPDLLVIAALLHDIGKGRPGDHTEVGVGLAAGITSRMGYPAADVEVICRLVEHHLLLSEVATRRDLDDPTTVMRVVSSVASASQLQLLAALTEADSLATGSAAWGPWKAELVGRLVERVLHVLEGGELSEVVEASFPTPAALERLARGGRVLEGAGDTLVVMADDRPGMFSRVAGVLALHGLDVMSAAAHSRAGRALSEFHVRGRLRPEIRWERVVADLERALDGRLALQSRLAERSRTYRRRDARGPRPGVHVRVDNHASAEWTVIDVHASDGEGVLYRITRAFAELDLDIRSAKVETQAGTVVDAFYVSDAHGAKITDTDTLAELERAITHSLAE